MFFAGRVSQAGWNGITLGNILKLGCLAGMCTRAQVLKKFAEMQRDAEADAADGGACFTCLVSFGACAPYVPVLLFFLVDQWFYSPRTRTP